MSNREKAWVLVMAAGFSLSISAACGDSIVGTTVSKMLAMLSGGLIGAGFVGWWLSACKSGAAMKITGRTGE